MKILIWVLCSLGFAIITTILAGCGLFLGGIPMALLAFGAFALARYLCRQWDNRKAGSPEDPLPAGATLPMQDGEGSETVEAIEGVSTEQLAEDVPADPAPEKIHTDTPSTLNSNKTDYKIPFIASAITAAVLAICAIIAVISASNMYSESEMKQSYSKAYNSGYEAGLQSGQEDGFQSGYDTGYNDGYSSGSDDGYIEGYCRGYTLSARDLADDEIGQRLFIKLLDYLAEYSYAGYSEYYNWLQNFRNLLK